MSQYSSQEGKRALLKQRLLRCCPEEICSILKEYHNENPKDIDFYFSKEDGLSFITFLCSAFDVKIVDFWHRLTNCKFDLPDTAGSTTILHAVNTSNKPLVEYLLAKQVDLNISTNEGFTPLVIAVINQDASMVKLLLENKAQVDGDPRCDNTRPREIMIHDEQDELLHKFHLPVSRLFRRRNKTTPTDILKCHHTPLQAAMLMGDVEICKILLDAHANIGDGLGLHSPLYVGRISGDDEIRNLFITRFGPASQ